MGLRCATLNPRRIESVPSRSSGWVYAAQLSILAGWSQYHPAVADGSNGEHLQVDRNQRARLTVVTYLILFRTLMIEGKGSCGPIRYRRWY